MKKWLLLAPANEHPSHFPLRLEEREGVGGQKGKKRKKKLVTPVGLSCNLNNPSGYPEDVHVLKQRKIKSTGLQI